MVTIIGQVFTQVILLPDSSDDLLNCMLITSDDFKGRRSTNRQMVWQPLATTIIMIITIIVIVVTILTIILIVIMIGPLENS